MQPAQSGTRFKPVKLEALQFTQTYVWNGETPSPLSQITVTLAGNRKAISLNFDPPEMIVPFCYEHDFRLCNTIAGHQSTLGCISLSSPTDVQKVYSILLSTCQFAQESDKDLIKGLLSDFPRPPNPSNCKVALNLDGWKAFRDTK